MIPAAVFLAAFADTLATLLTARALYGRWRANSIDWSGEPLPEAQRRWDHVDRPFATLGALLVAVVWPLVAAGWLANRWMGTTPVRSRREVAAEREAMARRIRELETDLGITEGSAR